MIGRRIPALLLALVIAAGMMTGCGGKEGPAPSKAPTEVHAESRESSAPSESSTRIITDMVGREVEIPVSPERVATLSSTARILTYAGAADKIVGVTEVEQGGQPGMPHSYIMHDLFSKAVSTGNGRESYDEAIAELSPDILFNALIDAGEADELQKKLGVPVVILAYRGVFSQSVYDALTLVGDIMGTSERSEKVINAMKGWEKDLNDRTKDIPDEEKPRVYAGAVSFSGGHGIEGTYANYPPFDAINAVNVADETGQKAAFSIDKEQLVVWDPDIIFLTPNNMHLVNDDYKINPSYYDNLRAVREGNVYSQVSYNWFSTNIELAIADAYYAGTVVFPEQFADLDFEAKAEEIFEVFLGRPYLDVLKADNNTFGKIRIGE